MRNLESSYDPEASRIAAMGRDSIVDEKANYLIDVAKVAKIQKSTGHYYKEPKTFDSKEEMV